MKKVTEQREELESVAGGALVTFKCPNCNSGFSEEQLNPERIDGTCDGTRKFTCPKCGYSWVF